MKLTAKQIQALRAAARGQKIAAPTRRRLQARGYLDTAGAITAEGTAALPLAIVQAVRAVEPGRRDGLRDLQPEVAIDQPSRTVTVARLETAGYQKKKSLTTSFRRCSVGADGQGALVTVAADLKDWQERRYSGEQTFCYAIFLGDSGHIYVHRPPATASWLEADASGEALRYRLRKLGGATRGSIQQGDLLFCPANGQSLPAEAFAHEVPGVGHHTFGAPILFGAGDGGRVYLVPAEGMEVVHRPTTGAVHPTITLPAGQWIVRTTPATLQGGGID